MSQTAIMLHRKSSSISDGNDPESQDDESSPLLLNARPHDEVPRKAGFDRTFFEPLIPAKPTIIKMVMFFVACIIAIILYDVPTILSDEPAARRCLSLFVFVAILWATEAIPLYSTSLLIPILIVSFQVIVDPDTKEPLDPEDAATQVIASMFSEVVLIAMGAFTISLGLAKYNLSYRLAVAILSRVGTRPPVVMLAIMILGVFLSMFMNNVASPVVCVSLVQPLLQELGSQEVYAKTLLLGIAYSNNIGGMSSPISSPQNLLAAEVISSKTWNVTVNGEVITKSGGIGWGQWLAVSLPFSIMCTLVAWGFLWLVFRPKLQKVNPVPPKELEPLGVMHVVVVFVSVLTVLLWAISKYVTPVFGNSGIIGLIPVVTFFTFPVLKKADFKELSWDVLMLLSGGIALGHAIQSSNLLNILAGAVASVVSKSNEWVVLLAFASLIWLFGNFISHTVAAVIILPVIADVGCRIGEGDCAAGHYLLLVMASVFIDSGAMALPVTSFPNAQCFSTVDRQGNRFLSTFDFVKTGFILGIMEVLLLLSAGYGLMKVVF